MTDRQKILSEAERCSKCGKCRYYCPVFREIKTESAVARGRNHLTAEILKYGAGKFSNRTKELFSMCISCGACLENCPNKIDSPLLTLYTKPEIIKALGMDWKESFIYKFIIK
ncbi:MAG: 4Fe-4S dicluster domain-containing protein, partial [Fibrobacterota bacterium]